MRYQTRKGVVLTSVCGEYLLVSAAAAREHCPYVSQINETSAFLWRELEKGRNTEELKQAILDEYAVEEPLSLDEMLMMILNQFAEMGYLEEIAEGEEHETV